MQDLSTNGPQGFEPQFELRIRPADGNTLVAYYRNGIYPHAPQHSSRYLHVLFHYYQICDGQQVMDEK
ncbi:hypothetical protein DPMN_132267 [Dreissena polymorpha]|uniref:Uncharacterized protein n=1 Tax=Dreissena polymorpha TaxID=45954 RepID=A0A9D4FS64_DREPO|nr:hypothetical protein DPMN_132267 [Dreissena polymorpha]